MADLEVTTDGLSRNGTSPREGGVAHSITTSGKTARPPLRERFSWMSLLRHGLSGSPWKRVWRDHELRPSYDVVIIGGGVHGLATAYYLAANHGITNVAVLDPGYLGGGGAGQRNAVPRA